VPVSELELDEVIVLEQEGKTMIGKIVGRDSDYIAIKPLKLFDLSEPMTKIFPNTHVARLANITVSSSKSSAPSKAQRTTKKAIIIEDDESESYIDIRCKCPTCGKTNVIKDNKAVFRYGWLRQRGDDFIKVQLPTIKCAECEDYIPVEPPEWMRWEE